MTNPSLALSSNKLRRLALSHQGLLGRSGFGSKSRGVLNAIEHLSYVQIDTISVVERAHHHILWSRVPSYQSSDIDKLMEQKLIFEYWAHAAAYLPMRDYRYALPRMEAIKNGQMHWFRNRDRKLMRYCLDRIRAEGPLMARDFEHKRPVKAQGWWDWKPAKRALEQLFMEGELMAVKRSGFQKVYDLRERALPDNVDTSTPSMEDYAKHLTNSYLRSHAFATPKAISYLRRNAKLRSAIMQILQQGLAAGTLLKQNLEKGEALYIDATHLSTKLRKPIGRLKLLSPFDNAIIQRDRAMAVHNFDYQIECYVPAPKRKFGYFSLPILLGDTFIGRVDCKAHRKIQMLEIINLCFDPAYKPELDKLLPELKSSLWAFARFNSCNRIQISRVSPKPLKQSVVALFK